MSQWAADHVSALKTWLDDVFNKLPGVTVGSARAKDPAAALEKMAAKKRLPAEIADYLGGRLVIDDWEALDRALKTSALGRGFWKRKIS